MSRIAALRKTLSEAPWQLWTAQLVAILGVELKRNFHRFRNLWLYVLTLAPVVLLSIRAMHTNGAYWTVEEDTRLFAYIFQIYYLRLAIFFGCMGLFTWLFRGEIVQKSLHYYFLSPVRRELLVVGKYLSGWVTASVFFGISVVLAFFLTYSHLNAAGPVVSKGPEVSQLVAYLGVTVLACLGYGAIFVALSLFIRNPIIPGVIVLVWETFHPIFPALLQKFSVTFYLQQLCPVEMPPDGIVALFRVIAEPVSPWIAVPGLLCLSALVLILACLKMRKLEISYVTD